MTDGAANVDPEVMITALLNIRDYNGDLSPRSFKLICEPAAINAQCVHELRCR